MLVLSELPHLSFDRPSITGTANTPKTLQMFQTLHASHNGNLYWVQLHDRDDIADLVREHRLETAGSRDNTFVFWFTPATHSSHMQLNKQATELLLMTTAFAVRQVPLMRGNIVITGNDGQGDPAELTADQMNRLINAEPTGGQEWLLSWRFRRDERAQRRARRSTEGTRMAAVMRAWR
jgi:hypothetical protein